MPLPNTSRTFTANGSATMTLFSEAVNWAVAVRFKLSSAASAHQIIGDNADHYLRVNSPTTITLFIDGSLHTFTVPTITTGVWHSLIINANGAAMRCYLDGVESTTGPLTDSKAFEPTTIGRAAGNVCPFMHDLRLFGRRLTPGEISGYANPLAAESVALDAGQWYGMEEIGTILFDRSGNGNHATVVAGVSFDDAAATEYSLNELLGYSSHRTGYSDANHYTRAANMTWNATSNLFRIRFGVRKFDSADALVTHGPQDPWLFRTINAPSNQFEIRYRNTADSVIVINSVPLQVNRIYDFSIEMRPHASTGQIILTDNNFVDRGGVDRSTTYSGLDLAVAPTPNTPFYFGRYTSTGQDAIHHWIDYFSVTLNGTPTHEFDLINSVNDQIGTFHMTQAGTLSLARVPRNQQRQHLDVLFGTLQQASQDQLLDPAILKRPLVMSDSAVKPSFLNSAGGVKASLRATATALKPSLLEGANVKASWQRHQS